MEEINIKDITLFEEVESKEAKQIYLVKQMEYNKKKFLYSLLTIGIFIILNIIMVIINVNIPMVDTTPLIIIFYLALGTTIIGIFIHYAKLIKPFKDMYYLAYENDRTRHKAKLFYKEFKRQKKGQINKITKEEIINSNTRASKEINIEKLKEINKKGKN